MKNTRDAAAQYEAATISFRTIEGRSEVSRWITSLRMAIRGFFASSYDQHGDNRVNWFALLDTVPSGRHDSDVAEGRYREKSFITNEARIQNLVPPKRTNP